MNEFYIFWICIIVAIFGSAILAGLIIFGTLLIGKSLWHRNDFRSWDRILLDCVLMHPPRLQDIPKNLQNAYNEYLQRRNEFWTTYGQITLSVLVALVLTILLLTKTINADAGLPILSAISGFAIAKGVSGSKSVDMPSEPISEPKKDLDQKG